MMSKYSEKINAVPGERLYLDVRSGFVRQKTTMTAWCKRNGVSQPGARLALLGAWNGPKAKKLRAALIAASGVDPRQHLAA